MSNDDLLSIEDNLLGRDDKPLGRGDAKLEVDFISKIGGYGGLTTAQTDNLRGINTHKTGTAAPKNKDAHGYTFFTRPDLNLTDENIAAVRMLSPLLSDDDSSMARALRCMLDPRSERYGPAPVKSAIFEQSQAFIPVLTNNLISMSGWPDIAVDTYTSKEGVYKESYSMVDGTSHLYNTFDITANFQNIQGDPITLLFTIWVVYSSMVYDGTMVPYPDLILNNEIDYMSRIYRLVMDETNTYVQKIAACGASFPMASPLGASFNYSAESEFNSDNDQISIPFRCIGVNYLDPILVKEFNLTVEGKNPEMSDGIRDFMFKISARKEYPIYGMIGSTLSKYLGHKLHPRIEPKTMELEWYASYDDYTNAINELLLKGIISK